MLLNSIQIASGWQRVSWLRRYLFAVAPLQHHNWLISIAYATSDSLMIITVLVLSLTSKNSLLPPVGSDVRPLRVEERYKLRTNAMVEVGSWKCEEQYPPRCMNDHDGHGRRYCLAHTACVFPHDMWMYRTCHRCGSLGKISCFPRWPLLSHNVC